MEDIDCKELVNRILSQYDTAQSLTIDETKILLNSYIKMSSNQSMLARIRAGSILVSGDIHGDFTMMRSIIDKFLKAKKTDHLLFLGDIVDRGSHSIACMNLFFALKLKYPNKVHIVRGNHESLPVNSRYGFLDEVSRYYYNEEIKVNPLATIDYLPELYLLYNKAFSLMPLAIIHEKLRFFFVHGGIPIESISLQEIKDLPREYVIQENQIVKQFLWNDPKENIDRHDYSIRGDGIFVFGKALVDEFLEMNNLSKIIRAHEVFPEGFKFFFDKKLLSLFTSEEYYTYVQGKIALIKENGEINIFSPKI